MKRTVTGFTPNMPRIQRYFLKSLVRSTHPGLASTMTHPMQSSPDKTLLRCSPPLRAGWSPCMRQIDTWRAAPWRNWNSRRSEEHTSELQSRLHLVCRLLLEKKKKNTECTLCIFDVSRQV